MEIGFKHTTKVRVRYGETDQMGYCYYGNYALYFEVGRVETMRNFGMSYKELEAQGVMLPVRDFHVRYLKPALYDQELSILTTIVALKGVQLVFNYEIRNEEEELLVIGSTSLVFVSKETMKPMQAPSNFTALILKQTV